MVMPGESRETYIDAADGFINDQNCLNNPIEESKGPLMPFDKELH